MNKSAFALIIFFLFLFFSFNTFGQVNIESFKTEALNEMKSGRFGEAIDLLNKYISAQPQVAEGYNLRGICYEKRSQFEYAVYDFRSARKLDPKNLEINSNLKRTTDSWYSILYNNIEGYRREIAINPGDPQNYLQIGKSYKNLGEWLTAEEWYDKYLSREEASPDEIIRYTEILAKDNHLSKGEPILKKYAQKYSDDHRIWSRYGYFSLWLGKKQIAINAFEKALELRPFFKEAMDGLDRAKGKGFIYTVNDTSTRHRKYYGSYPNGKKSVYPIDKFYRILKSDSSNNEIRVSLIKALMKVNRVEEAYNQLNVLLRNNPSSTKYDSLSSEVIAFRENYYQNKINDLEAKLKKNPYDKIILNKLAEYYAITKQYDKAVKIYGDYLVYKPDDLAIRNKLALNYSLNKDFKNALAQTEIILQKDPNNINSKLLNAQLSVWLNQNLDEAEKNLQYILNKEPNNFQALVTLGTLNFQKKKYENARYYASLAEKLNPDNFDLDRLKYILNLQVKRDKEAARFHILEEARKLSSYENCDESIKKYKLYIAETEKGDIKLSKEIPLELANAFICAKNYKAAISIYDSLLSSAYDYEIEKQRAKVSYWSGDSIKALIYLKDAASKNPNDAEIKLLLGDSYAQNKNYESAEKVYKELLAKAPDSYILKQRLGWLPNGEESSSLSIPTYVLVSPEFDAFSDNQSFRYNIEGLKLETGITKFLSVAGSAYRGSLSSDSTANKLNFNIFKGHLYLKLSNIFLVSGSYGQTFFNNSERREIFQAGLKAEEENKYLVALNFNSMDAAQLLYSPNLVNNRLKADDYSIEAKYQKLNGVTASINFSYIYVYDNNSGNELEFRIGKEIFSDLTLGYEYFYNTYKKVSSLYYSPSNFESHSIWGNLNLIKNEKVKLDLGGKIGAISGTNYILREAHAEAEYKILKDLSIQGSIRTGSTKRNEEGYSSLSIFAAVFWGL